MYELPEKKIAFIAHPRTASSATGHALLEMGFIQRQSHHQFNPKWDLNGWFVACTVRNPLDVMASWYHNRPREEKCFNEWLPTFIEACLYLQGERMFFGRPYCNHILRFENLQRDFDTWLEIVGLPPKEIPRRNVSEDKKGKPFMTYYNLKLARMVIERFKLDFAENDYPIPALKGI